MQAHASKMPYAQFELTCGFLTVFKSLKWINKI